MIRLDIGCGPTVEDGWIGVDPAGTDSGVMKNNAWDLAIVLDGSVDEIRCHHALEHFPPDKLDATMAEWLRVLKPGGTVEITVPDAAYVLQYLIDHPRDPWAHTMVYGRNLYPGDGHLTAWDVPGLVRLLSRAGLSVADRGVRWDEFHNQDSAYAIGVKPR